jgi:hypothetical protein
MVIVAVGAWFGLPITVRRAVPVTAPDAAEIVVCPSPIAVAKPFTSIVAMERSNEDQEKELPATAYPLASDAVALNCRVPPILVNV